MDGLRTESVASACHRWTAPIAAVTCAALHDRISVYLRTLRASGAAEWPTARVGSGGVRPTRTKCGVVTCEEPTLPKAQA